MKRPVATERILRPGVSFLVQDAYRVLDEIRTDYGAHTLVVDPISQKVFVGYAILLSHPRIAVFSPMMGRDVEVKGGTILPSELPSSVEFQGLSIA